MFASPALCHFRKTRTQCLSERTEKNHGASVGIVGFRAGMEHKTFRICCTLHVTTCQPYNHLRNRTLYDCCRPGRTLRIYPPSAVLFQMYTSFFISSPSSCCDSSQRHFQGSLSITTLLGASGRFIWKSGVWQRWKCAIWRTASTTFRGVTTVSHGLALFMFLNCLQNATLAPSSSRLSCLFSYSRAHVEYFLRSW